MGPLRNIGIAIYIRAVQLDVVGVSGNCYVKADAGMSIIAC